jgi:hypothetical protein
MNAWKQFLRRGPQPDQTLEGLLNLKKAGSNTVDG